MRCSISATVMSKQVISDSIKSMPPVKRRMVPMGFALLKHDDDSGAAV